jgi:hypothetical protein
MTVTLEVTGGQLRDRETSSVWTSTGEAVSGPLAGARLEPVVHGNHFWFAWAVFFPDTEVRRTSGDLKPKPG